MALNDQAAEAKRRFLAEADPAITDRVGAGLAALAEANPARRALGVGDRAPDFERPGIRGGSIKLSRQLRRGPVVLSFYRGGWCPFCSLELQAWQARIDHVHAAGGQLIAISPEAGDRARADADAKGLDFPIITDANQAVAEGFGLVFELPEATAEAQRLLDAPLDRLNADGTWRLPLPATFVIDRGGVIRWAFVDDDYTKRAEPDEVIEVLHWLARQRRTA